MKDYDADTSLAQVTAGCKSAMSTNHLQADNQSQAETGLNSGSDKAEGR
jgi:hypothetical protein